MKTAKWFNIQTTDSFAHEKCIFLFPKKLKSKSKLKWKLESY